MTSIATRPNPFPGLRPFEANEDHLFFGRDGQSDEILGRLRRNRFLAVVGTSGSGKSSLIRAGLLPSLYGGLMTKAGSNWRIAVFRPGNDAIRNLTSALSAPGVLGRDGADALQTIFTETTLRRSALGVIDATRQARMPAEDNLLIVVDQFEELFRFRRTGSRPDDEAAAFVKLLLEATRQTEVPIYVVITMRSDFIGDCARFRDLPETVNEGLYLIPRMTRDQRREAITGPIAVGGAQIAPRLVNRLLNDVGDSPDQLPILQHALMRTWSNWSHESDGSEPIDLKHYEAIGGMAEALSRHADRAYSELPDERSRQIAEKLFKCLTEKGLDNREVRRPTSVSEICAVAGAQESEVIAVIEPFRRSGRSFLMPPSTVPLNADSLIDISHESLIRNWDRLRGWVEAEALSATIYRRVADTAVLYSEGHAGLWRDPDLQVALGWREKADPNAAWAERYHRAFDAAMRFLDESRAARDAHVLRREMLRRRELRRTRAFAFVLGVALLIATALGVYAVLQKTDLEVAKLNLETANTGLAKKAEEAAAAVEQAQIAERRAEKNATRAEANLKVAQEKTKLAQQKTTEAVQARQGLARQKIIAETKRQEAELLAEKLRLVALRMRTQNLHDNQTINTLADKLIETSSPEQAMRWRRYKDVALSKIGDHDGAIREATVALDTNPNYLSARFGRGYEYLLAGKPEEAVKDTGDYLKSNPESTTGYLNLALGQAMLKRYPQASSSIRQALDKFVYSSGENFDSEVSPDITRATGQVVIYMGGDAFKVALHYQLANLSASEGPNDFEKTLTDTDKSVSELRAKRATGGAKCGVDKRSTGGANSDAEMLDGYLSAINWAWLHMRVAPNDYGALVSQGALYERASNIQHDFKEWAWRSYNKFMQKYQKDPDPKSKSRYDELAKWSAKRMADLYPQDPPAELPEEKPNARKLALEAAELEERKHWDGAHEVINRAITLEPDNVDLLIQRVSLRYEKKDYAGVREDCERILCLAERTPEAYEYLALLPSSSDSQKRENYEKALRYSPLSRLALDGLARLSEKESDPRKALEYVERAIGVSPFESLLYQRKARLQNQVGLAQAALESIEHAIALKQDNTDFYDLREKIERKLGRSEAEVVVGKAAGYREAGDAMLRLGKTADALNTYLKGIEIQGPLLNGSEEARSEAMVAVRRISRLVGSQSSKEKARAFWETVKLSGYLKGAEQVLEKEIVRLSDAP